MLLKSLSPGSHCDRSCPDGQGDRAQGLAGFRGTCAFLCSGRVHPHEVSLKEQVLSFSGLWDDPVLRSVCSPRCGFHVLSGFQSHFRVDFYLNFHLFVYMAIRVVTDCQTLIRGSHKLLRAAVNALRTSRQSFMEKTSKERLLLGPLGRFCSHL